MSRSFAVLIYLLIATVNICAEDKALYAQASKESDLWPTHLSVTEAVQSNGRELVPGPPGVLMRIEDGQALIDFGRRGVHWVDLSKTDFISRSESMAGSSDIKLGNYVLMFGGNIAQIHDGGLQRPERDWHVQVKNLLLVYLQPEAMSAATIDELKRINQQGKSAAEPFQIILLPMQVLIPRDGSRIDPTLSDFLIIPYPISEAYAKAMCHVDEPIDALSFVMIDKNGMLLSEQTVENLLEPKGAN